VVAHDGMTILTDFSIVRAADLSVRA
jgi:hypothetical protein